MTHSIISDELISVAHGVATKILDSDLKGLNPKAGILAGKMHLKIETNGRKMISIRSSEKVEIFASQNFEKPSEAINDFKFEITGILGYNKNFKRYFIFKI